MESLAHLVFILILYGVPLLFPIPAFIAWRSTKWAFRSAIFLFPWAYLLFLFLVDAWKSAHSHSSTADFAVFMVLFGYGALVLAGYNILGMGYNTWSLSTNPEFRQVSTGFAAAHAVVLLAMLILSQVM